MLSHGLKKKKRKRRKLQLPSIKYIMFIWRREMYDRGAQKMKRQYPFTAGH